MSTIIPLLMDTLYCLYCLDCPNCVDCDDSPIIIWLIRNIASE